MTCPARVAPFARMQWLPDDAVVADVGVSHDEAMAANARDTSTPAVAT